jgi:hypothetical protein
MPYAHAGVAREVGKKPSISRNSGFIHSPSRFSALPCFLFTRLSDRATRAPFVPSVMGRMVRALPSVASYTGRSGSMWSSSRMARSFASRSARPKAIIIGL